VAVDIPVGLESFFWIVLAAALAPLIVGLLPGPKVPEVVILLLLGMVIGPEALGLATKEGPILLLNDVGLGFLFFIAGYELNPRVLKGRTGLQAATSWAVSMALALSVVGVLYEIGYVKAFLPVAIALTSTALGTLLPILRDAGLLDTKLGRLVVANGAVGEFGPVLAISLFLGSRGAWASLVILLVFAVIAVAIDRIPRVLVTRRISAIFEHGSETTQQTTLRWTVLLLVGLLLMAAEFGLDVILGAFAAGLILRQLTPDGDEAWNTSSTASRSGCSSRCSSSRRASRSTSPRSSRIRAGSPSSSSSSRPFGAFRCSSSSAGTCTAASWFGSVFSPPRVCRSSWPSPRSGSPPGS